MRGRGGREGGGREKRESEGKDEGGKGKVTVLVCMFSRLTKMLGNMCVYVICRRVWAMCVCMICRRVWAMCVCVCDM